MDTRFAVRRAEVKRQDMLRRRRRTLVLLVLLGLVALGVWVERSPLVALEQVEVVGTRRIDPEEVREAAALRLGTSTLRLRLGPAEDRVKALPAVRSANVSRVDPLTVRITVDERTPALVLRAGNGNSLVDEEGVVLARGSQDGLPVLSSGLPKPALGESVADLRGFAAGFQVQAGLPADVADLVVRYEVRGDDVQLILASEVRVLFGRPDRIAAKATAMRALVGEIGEETDVVLDVRAPGNPVIAPASPHDA
ncbi:MAG: cell division protein FtsQ/DivIB [Nitriliruptorales bacterium]